MINRIILILSLLIPSITSGQQKGCNDTVESYHFTSPNLRPQLNRPFIVDKNENSIVQVDTMNWNVGELPNIGLVKLNKTNQLIFRKTYSQQNLPYDFTFELAFADNENSLIFSGGTSNNTTERKGIVTRIDSSGTMQWQKMYLENPNTDKDNFFYKTIAGQFNDIIGLSYQYNNDSSSCKITLLDSTGNIKWAKSYYNNPGGIFPVMKPLICFDGKEIVLTGEYLYGNIYRNAFFITSINYQDGSIINTASFSFSNNQSPTWPYTHVLKDLKYDKASKKYVLLLLPDERIIKGFTSILIDSTFSTVKAKTFSFPGLDNFDAGLSAEDKFITNCYPVYQDNSLYYAVINNSLEIVSQKKIKFNDLGLNFGPLFLGKLGFRKNETSNLMVNSFGAAGGDQMLFVGGAPGYKVSNDCLGYDTTFLHTFNTAVLITTPVINAVRNWPLQAISLPISPAEDKGLQIVTLCRQQSICDTIRISGPTKACSGNTIYKFDLYRNPACLRKTKWQIDTNYINIVNQTDTSVSLKFTSSYRGYIYAGFEGCTLRDSIWIEVYSPKQSLSLGNDIEFCPGKHITLDAGNGFKFYSWQDGSTLQTYNTQSPGKYYITATDSCNNIFSDTILVIPSPVNFKADYPFQLCLYDSASIVIPSQLHNITWQPAGNGFASNNTLILFPQTTTLYTISGETNTHCTLTDTLELVVKKCPNYLYFPTGFTPNNDGINDNFKPLISGKLREYEITIYNRWGQAVFKSTNPLSGWNGLSSNGRTEIGSYVYMCKYRFLNEPMKFKKGSFILIR